jgi:strictosidine synthase
MLRWIGIIVGVLAAMILFAAHGPGALNAVKFEPVPQNPDLLAMFEDVRQPANEEAQDFFGAEDLEEGPDRRLYASLADGRIMARSVDGEWSEFANTGGRPLGLSFGPEGRLFVADAKLGLLVHEGTEFETWLAQAPEGPLVFTDDLTVLDNGTVILTDASKRHPYGDHILSFAEGEQTGAVYKITGPDAYEQIASGYGFINGVDHDPETGLVYLNETWAGQSWVLDPTTNEMTLLITGLPGYPDNIEFDPNTGLIWIALPAMRSAELEPLHPRPFLKKLVWRLIQIAGEPPLPPMPAMALAVDRDGNPVFALSGPNHHETGITTATPWQGQVWTAGLERSAIDAYDVPDGIVAPALLPEAEPIEDEGLAADDAPMEQPE